MVDFAEIADLIADVVTDEGLGASVVLTSVTPGAYDPSTGTTGAATTTTQTVDAIVEDYRGLELLNGLVQAGDKKVSIPASSLTTAPKPTDTLTIGGVAHLIVAEPEKTEAGGVTILHVLRCRRS
jgi:hypothetical protein